MWQTAKGLLAFALPQVKELYALLETEFDPMGLPTRVSPLLDALEDLSSQHKLSAASPIPKVDLHQYAPALRRLAALRTLAQVHSELLGCTMRILALVAMAVMSSSISGYHGSLCYHGLAWPVIKGLLLLLRLWCGQIGKVYDIVRIPNLWKMLAPCGPPVYVESALVEGINHGFLKARLDFSEGIVTFGEPVSFPFPPFPLPFLPLSCPPCNTLHLVGASSYDCATHCTAYVTVVYHTEKGTVETGRSSEWMQQSS